MKVKSFSANKVNLMNKKPLIFISDFDGTITKKDFYLIMIEKYLGWDYEKKVLERCKAGKITSFDYLNEIMGVVNQTEEQIKKDIDDIEIDEYVLTVMNKVKEVDGDFIVVSAGNSYYVEPSVRKFLGENIPVYANNGYYKDGGLIMDRENKHPHFCNKFGIDKRKIVDKYKELYETVIFAGDSSPDYRAGIASHIRFAKGLMKKYYDRDGIEYCPYNSFKDIEEELINRGILN